MASSLPLGPADRASFEENGFLHVRGALSKQDCMNLVGSLHMSAASPFTKLE